jgi:hypothetical protein
MAADMRPPGQISDGIVGKATFAPVKAKPGTLTGDRGAVLIEPPP